MATQYSSPGLLGKSSRWISYYTKHLRQRPVHSHDRRVGGGTPLPRRKIYRLTLTAPSRSAHRGRYRYNADDVRAALVRQSGRRIDASVASPAST